MTAALRPAALLLLLLVPICVAFLLPNPGASRPPHHLQPRQPQQAGPCCRSRRPQPPPSAVLGGLWGGAKRKQEAAAGSGPEKELNAACKAKAQSYARGGTTAPALLAFLKAQAAKDKTGPTLDEMVQLSVALVADEKKRALLLSSYQSVAGAAQAARLTKFAGAASPSASFRAGARSGTAGSSDASSLVGGKYRLDVSSAGGARVSSGKSAVVDAVLVDSNVPVKVKLSRNLAVLKREADNLRRLSGCRSVIRVLDFFENYDRRGGNALVLEAGEEDLVGLVRRSGALGRGDIKRICGAALAVLGALEKERLVWTDLRASNFVRVGKKGETKAIDLESAVPVGELPVDCTPEVTPPEVARLYVAGQIAQARVAPAYDVWSLGCLVLFLASGGKTLFHGAPPNKAMLSMATLTPEIVGVELARLVPNDARTRAFLERVLVVDPAKRPTLGALRRDLYLASPF